MTRATNKVQKSTSKGNQMTVKAVKKLRGWVVDLSQEGQTFSLHTGAKSVKRSEALWYAKMFKVALKNHNEELLLDAAIDGKI